MIQYDEVKIMCSLNVSIIFRTLYQCASIRSYILSINRFWWNIHALVILYFITLYYIMN